MTELMVVQLEDRLSCRPRLGGGRLDYNSQIVGWWLVQHGKCCVYTKRMISQNFRIYEKKLARRRAYLVYKGKSWILQWGKT